MRAKSLARYVIGRPSQEFWRYAIVGVIVPNAREQFACNPSWNIIVALVARRDVYTYFTKTFPEWDWCFRNSIRRQYDWSSGFFFFFFFFLSSCQDAKTFFLLSVCSGFFHPRLFSRHDCNGWRNPSCYRGNIYTSFSRSARTNASYFPDIFSSHVLGKTCINSIEKLNYQFVNFYRLDALTVLH